jgi:hypothetical protein
MKKRLKSIFKCFLVLMIILYPYLMAIKLIRCAMGLTHIDWFDAIGIILYMFLMNGVIE